MMKHYDNNDMTQIVTYFNYLFNIYIHLEKYIISKICYRCDTD